MVKGCFNERIMETAYSGMVDALTTMIKEESLESGGVFEDTREMMIKVRPLFCGADQADGQLTLLVIGSAGFGMNIPWTIPKTDGKICRPFWSRLDQI